MIIKNNKYSKSNNSNSSNKDNTKSFLNDNSDRSYDCGFVPPRLF